MGQIHLSTPLCRIAHWRPFQPHSQALQHRDSVSMRGGSLAVSAALVHATSTQQHSTGGPPNLLGFDSEHSCNVGLSDLLQSLM